MSEAIPLLTVPQAIEAAAALCQRVDGALTVARALTGVPDATVVSIAILVGQLDTIARAAAAFSLADRDLDAWSTLQEHLLAAGYLPLQNIPATKEHSDVTR